MDEDLANKVESARKALNESELLRERLRVLDEALAAVPVGAASSEHPQDLPEGPGHR